MADTRDDGADAPKPKPSAPDDARLARKAEALRANLKRRKMQSRGRAERRDEGSGTGD